jgi:S-adenosylmethionine synthetase
MFGYATDETEECMPLTVVLAHKLNYRIAELRRSGELWWARPDTKTQVSVDFFCFCFCVVILSALIEPHAIIQEDLTCTVNKLHLRA